MGKRFLLLILLATIGSGFSYEPIFKDFCSNLSSMKISLNDSSLNGSYYNLTEIPKEFLTVINQKLANNTDLTLLTKSLDNVTFSAEIYYNKTLCFSGSILFLNSSLEFFRLTPDPLKGTSNNHVYFYAELSNLEVILNEWIELSKSQETTDPMKFVFLAFRTTKEMIMSMLRNDFQVKPFSGIFKVFDLLKVLPQLSISKSIESNLMRMNSSFLI